MLLPPSENPPTAEGEEEEEPPIAEGYRVLINMKDTVKGKTLQVGGGVAGVWERRLKTPIESRGRLRP